MGLTGLFGAALSACGLDSPDYSALDAELKAGLARIAGVRVTKARWGASGVSQAVVVELALTSASSSAAARVGRDVLAVVTPLTKKDPASKGDGTFALTLTGPDGALLARAADLGLPGTIAAIRAS